ncbi:SH3 domain-containing protein [Rhizobium helianthi]|uniref:SH3 domain-containing protein n=1 Tax=Rhizobium helianthi TaxID=1132695 RepID=A0ABW4M162_9HYPH
MKRQIWKAMAITAFCALPAVASAASSGIATANVNMRSGPSTRYPAVVVIPAGAPITINGCLNNVNWCDVTFARGRGWVSGSYIQATYRQNRVYVAPNYYRSLGIPTITFDVDTYWGRYYRDRDFYRERDRWRSWDYRRDLPPPPPPGWRERDPDRDWARDRLRDEQRFREEQRWRDERRFREEQMQRDEQRWREERRWREQNRDWRDGRPDDGNWRDRRNQDFERRALPPGSDDLGTRTPPDMDRDFGNCAPGLPCSAPRN